VSRRLLVSIGALVVLAACIGVAGGCKDDRDAKRGTKQSAYVVERIVPFGKLVGVAVDDGSVLQREMPGDIVPDDAVSSVDDDLRCQVAVRDLPIGTVLRRSMFAEPSKVGLERGLTEHTAQPTGCS